MNKAKQIPESHSSIEIIQIQIDINLNFKRTHPNVDHQMKAKKLKVLPVCAHSWNGVFMYHNV